MVLYGKSASMAARSTSSTVTIADAASLSGAVDLGEATLVGIILPSGWDTNVITFAASDALAGTYVPIVNAAGTEVTTGSIAASKWVALDPADFASVQFLKVRSGTSGAAVNQSGAVVLTLVTRAV